MATYAVIDTISLKVINNIEWDGVTPWTPPENKIAQEDALPVNMDVYVDQGTYLVAE